MRDKSTTYTPPSQPLKYQGRKINIGNDKESRQTQSSNKLHLETHNDESHKIYNIENKYRATNASMIRYDKNMGSSMSLNNKLNGKNFKPATLNKLARTVQVVQGDEILLQDEINHNTDTSQVPYAKTQSQYEKVARNQQNLKYLFQDKSRPFIKSPAKFHNFKPGQSIIKANQNIHQDKSNKKQYNHQKYNTNIEINHPKIINQTRKTELFNTDRNVITSEQKSAIKDSTIIMKNRSKNVNNLSFLNHNEKNGKRMFDCDSTFNSSIATYYCEERELLTLDNDRVKDLLQIKGGVNIKRCDARWPLSACPIQNQLQFGLTESNRKQKWNDFKRKKPTDFLLMNSKLSKSICKRFTINDFQLLDKVGKGGFGDVWAARHKQTGFICVLKKLLKRKIKQDRLQQHLLGEIKIQSFLQHRHLTALYGYFHDEQYLYLIMEMLPDSSIKKKNKIPQEQVTMLIRQICDGLKYMHIEHVIHRDLKPENIFANQNYLKIGDFGCAAYCNNGTRSTLVGCIAYISPEQLQNQSYTDKIDVWSVGILTYELLTGTSPFENDIIEIIRKQRQPVLRQLVFPNDIPISDDAKSFICLMLNKNPDKRMNIKQALKHPFLTKSISESTQIKIM